MLGISHQRAHQLEQQATDEAWERLPDSTRRYLCTHINAPLPSPVWRELQSARFVAWWGRERNDLYDLDHDAWAYITKRSKELTY
jgi:hypothetical protein